MAEIKYMAWTWNELQEIKTDRKAWLRAYVQMRDDNAEGGGDRNGEGDEESGGRGR